MGNILNFNVNKIDMRLSNADYWDLYLAKGDFSVIPQDTILSGDCLVAHYDFNDINIYGTFTPYTVQYTEQYGTLNGTIISQYGEEYTSEYGSLGYLTNGVIYSLTTWDEAINTGYTLTTVGLTGIDNGLVGFSKPSGDTSNLALLDALTGSTLFIPSGDTRLSLTRVTGYTGNFVYPLTLENDSNISGTYARLCGGFYQGYYKLDGNSYQVLPNRVPNSWVAETWLRTTTTDNCTGDTGTTLNEVYTGNTGIFLYFGTRAENKFWNVFEGLNTGTTSGCTSGATEWCTIPKETDISFVDSSGNTINLSPPPTEYSVTDNAFLIYSRAGKSNNRRCGSCGGIHREGYTVCTFTGDTITIANTKEVVTDDRNPFLVYSRAGNGGRPRCGGCGDVHASGETICSFSGFTSPDLELDRDGDLVDNALAFRVTEDGSIGYRKLVMSKMCVSGVTVTGCTIEEAYSASGMVTPDQWNMISIRFVANTTFDDCELEWRPSRKGKLMFYVNSKLKFVVEEFDELIARRLVEHSDKQVAVPYNISLGGGTQGLLESMTFDGQDPRDMGSCLDENFAGSFIGDVSQFRFYICGMNYCEITNNFEKEKVRYGLT
jgi:hypothetical protein